MEHGRQATFVETNGTFAAIFCIPFLLAGLGAMGAGVYVVVAQQVSPVILTILVPFGLVFFCFGAAIGFSKHTLIIDGDAGTLTRTWGIVFTFKRTTQPLGTWEHVGLARERRRTQKASHIVYPVFLARQGDSFPVQTTRDYARARTIAERVAKACNLGLRDAGGEDVVTREPGKLDESLRERLRRTHTSIAVPKRPADARATTTTEIGTLVIDVPAPGLKSFAGFVAVAMLLGLVAQTVIMTLSSGELPIVFLPVDVVIIAVFIAPTLLRCFTAERLNVSATSLEILKRSPLGQRQTRVPAQKIEEVRLGDVDAGMLGAGLVLVTDDRVYTVASGRNIDERRWLAGEIQRALAGD